MIANSDGHKRTKTRPKWSPGGAGSSPKSIKIRNLHKLHYWRHPNRSQGRPKCARDPARSPETAPGSPRTFPKPVQVAQHGALNASKILSGTCFNPRATKIMKILPELVQFWTIFLHSWRSDITRKGIQGQRLHMLKTYWERRFKHIIRVHGSREELQK